MEDELQEISKVPKSFQVIEAWWKFWKPKGWENKMSKSIPTIQQVVLNPDSHQNHQESFRLKFLAFTLYQLNQISDAIAQASVLCLKNT
jgi:hypothetical protein